MILATVIYYKTAALASAVEKSMLVLTPLGIHFTWNKRTAFLRELSVYFLSYYLELSCLWDSWSFVNKLPLIYVIWIDFARLLTVWEPPSPVPCPVLETFLSSGSLLALPCSREQPSSTSSPGWSQFLEWSLICLQERTQPGLRQTRAHLTLLLLLPLAVEVLKWSGGFVVKEVRERLCLFCSPLKEEWNSGQRLHGEESWKRQQAGPDYWLVVHWLAQLYPLF